MQKSIILKSINHFFQSKSDWKLRNNSIYKSKNKYNENSK